MKKIIIIACALLCMASISGCLTSDGNNGGGNVISPTNAPPNVSTNNLDIIEDYYDSDLTPGDNGTNLTE